MSPMALLLLPPPPDPPSSSAVEIAYDPPLRSTLRKLVASASSSAAAPIDIDIALPCPEYILPPSSPPAKLPTLLAHLYTLIHSICTDDPSLQKQQQQQQQKQTQPSPLNPRILLLTYPSDIDYYTPLQTRLVPSSASCFVDLADLALSDRAWSRVFIVDGESGERLHRQFMSVVNSRFSSRVGGTWTTERVRGGLSLRVKRSSLSFSSSSTTTTNTSRQQAENNTVGSQSHAGRPSRIIIPGPLSPLTGQKKLQVTVALLLAELGGAIRAIRPGERTGGGGSVGLEGMSDLGRFVRGTVGVNPVDVSSVLRGVVAIEPYNVLCVEKVEDLGAYLEEGAVVVNIGGDERVKEVVERGVAGGRRISLFDLADEGD